jgi:dihydroxy-acid dehydratase
MEDFYYAGGLRALLARLRELLVLEAGTVAEGSLGDAISGAEVHDSEVIRPIEPGQP